MPAVATTLACPPSLWPLVARRSGLAWPARTAHDLGRFVGALERQRLLALAAQDPGLPADARAAVERGSFERAAHAAAIEGEQDAVLSEVAGGFPCDWIAVNGADFRTRLYPAARLRPMSDVDILVRPGDLPVAARWLIARGYAEQPPHPASIDRGFRRPGCEHWVDLYVAFGQRQRSDIDYREIWRERLIGTDGVPRLAPHHALTVHALRLANEQFVSPLRRFVDSWLLTRDEMVVRQAIETARRWRVARSMFAALLVLRRLLPESGAAAWQAEVDALVGARGRRRLERGVLRGAPFDALPSRPVQIWRKLLLLDTPSHRLRFLAAQVAERTRLVSPPHRVPAASGGV